MFDVNWVEMCDVPGEIYDVCPNTGILLIPGESPMSDKEIEEFHNWSQKNYDQDNEGWDHYWDEVWQESL